MELAPTTCAPPGRLLRRLALALVLLGAPASGVAGEPAIAVIVGVGPARPMSSALLAAIFRRKHQLWPDGSRVIPVNLPASDPLRHAFSLAVFDRSVEELQPFWDDQYFHGVLPPPVLASQEAVLRFVAETPGAVGYVAACRVDRRVVVVALLPDPGGAASCVP